MLNCSSQAPSPLASPPQVRQRPGYARVVGCPNPFAATFVDGWCRANDTVMVAMTRLCMERGVPRGWKRHARVWVDGRAVPRAKWRETIVREGQLVNFRIVPGKSGGGGGKNPMRMVMSIAVIAAAWYGGPLIASQLMPQLAAAGGGSIFGGSLALTMKVAGGIAGGVITLAGNALADAIAPTPTASNTGGLGSSSGEKTDPTYSLTGTGNALRKYEPLSVPLGFIRRQADHAAMPYSEASGSDQWGHYLFNWSLGQVELSDFKLGDTDLSVYLKSSSRDILPEMEAATTDPVTMSASVNSATAWRLGNNASSTDDSAWDGGSSLPVDVLIDLGSIRAFQGYTLRPHASYLSSMPTGWTLAAGKQADDLTDLDTRSGQTWPDAAKRAYELDAVAQARYLRLRFTAAGSSGSVLVDELEILGGLLMETWEGDEANPAYTLYSGNVHEESIGAALPWADGETSAYTVRYTEPGCTEFEIELYANQGLFRFPPNNSQSYGVVVNLEALYRLAGTEDPLKPVSSSSTLPASAVNKNVDVLGTVSMAVGDVFLISGVKYRVLTPFSWIPSSESFTIYAANCELVDESGAQSLWTVSVAGVDERADRRPCRFTLPSGTVNEGQYEIHLRRTGRSIGNSSPTDGTVFDNLYWSLLRTRRPGQAVTLEHPWSGTALAVKAGEDFSGSLPVFSALCKTVCPDWDAETQTWITRATNNPASLAVYWLLAPWRARPISESRIDYPVWQDFHEFCTAKGYTFNADAVLRGKSIWTVLRMICAAGRGSPLRPDGKFSVVWDAPQDEIVQQFNDRNIWNFKSTRKFGKLPHGLRIRFQDEENDFEEDEMVVYGDGYDATNATLFENLPFDGITKTQALWSLGRHAWAQLKQRPWDYSWQTSMEYIICRRGRLASVATSVIKIGLVYARSTSVVWDEAEEYALGLRLDQACAMQAGKNYAVRYRRSDGRISVQDVEFASYETRDLVFAEPVPAEIAPGVDNLVTFGERGNESLIVLVKSIIPAGDKSAIIIGCDYAPEIFNADSGEMPAWNPHITRSVLGRKVAAPVIESIRSGEETILVEVDGTLTVRAEVTLRVPGGAPVPASTLEVQYRKVGALGWSESIVSPVGIGSVYISGVEQGVDYEFRARALGSLGLESSWVESAPHTIVGKSSPPPDVPWLLAQVSGNVVTSRWGSVSVVDLGGYRMRAALKAVFDWETAQEVSSAEAGTLLATADLTPGEWRLGIKALDTSGNESVNATTCDVTIITSNWSIASQAQHPAWPGAAEGLIKDPLTGLLIPLSQSTLEDVTELVGTWATNPVTSAVYTSPELDTGSERSMRVFADLAGLVSPGSGQSVAESDLHLEIRSREEGGEYGAWARWLVGDISGRYVQFRAAWDPSLCPVALQAFTNLVDAPTRTEEGELNVPVGGMPVSFSEPFAGTPNIELINATGLVRFPVYSSATASGFDVDVYDVTETSVGGTARYKATGV